MTSNLSRLVRESVRSQHPYRAGTTVEEVRRRYNLGHIIKLSSNENPIGPSPHALAAMAHVDEAHIYVNDDYAELRGALAQHTGVESAQVLVGHGSNELARLIFSTFVDPGDGVVIADPTFSLYRKDAQLSGASIALVPLREGVHDLDAMAAAVTASTKLVIICDPNNPTSTQVDPAAFDRFLGQIGDDVLVLIDQAYREYQPPYSVDGVAVVRRRPNTIVLRTMSKVYGLAALRIGYAIAEPEIIDWIGRVRVPFNVTAPSIFAARAALADTGHVETVVALNTKERARVASELARLGVFAYPSAANFHAVRVPVEANRAYTELMERGIIVRSGDGLGLPNFLRVTVGLPEENDAFCSALEELLAGWASERKTYA